MDNIYIKVPDNYRNGKDYTFDRSVIEDLLFLGEWSLKELFCNYKNVLLYPYFYEDVDNINTKDKIFEYQSDKYNQIIIHTGNIVGFIGKNNKYLKIYSRFDNSNNDFFMHYMIEKVFNINIFNMNFCGSFADILDMMIILFPMYLQDAFGQGIYKEYITRFYNNDNVKGMVDVVTHIKMNLPFNGKIAYNAREYLCENDVFQLIRHTIEYIKTKEIGKAILLSSRDLIKDIQLIVENTKNYKKQDRQNVIIKNIKRPIKQPYYIKYKYLQDLCIKILSFENIMYGENENEVYGVLMDISWLFEEYIWTIIKKKNYRHSENRKKMGGISFFEGDNHRRYLDFYKVDEEGNMTILDTKYKMIMNKEKVSDCNAEDIDQLITYMFITKSKKSAFIYPKNNLRNNLEDAILKNSTYGGTIGSIGINISNEQNDYGEFKRQMLVNEEMFLKDVENF